MAKKNSEQNLDYAMSVEKFMSELDVFKVSPIPTVKDFFNGKYDFFENDELDRLAQKGTGLQIPEDYNPNDKKVKKFELDFSEELSEFMGIVTESEIEEFNDRFEQLKDIKDSYNDYHSIDKVIHLHNSGEFIAAAKRLRSLVEFQAHRLDVSGLYGVELIKFLFQNRSEYIVNKGISHWQNLVAIITDEFHIEDDIDERYAPKDLEAAIEFFNTEMFQKPLPEIKQVEEIVVAPKEKKEKVKKEKAPKEKKEKSPKEKKEKKSKKVDTSASEHDEETITLDLDDDSEL